MDTIFKNVLAAPVATLLIISGILFMFIAVAGNISGKIEPGAKGRIASGVLGFLLLAIGLTMHLTQKPAEVAAAQGQIKLDQQDAASQKPTTKTVAAPREATDAKASTADKARAVNAEPANSVSSMTESEPNDSVASANLFADGAIMHGSLSSDKNRDYYKFNATGNQTRVILRKFFGLEVEIYNAVEEKIDSHVEGGDTTLSFSFKSDAGSLYYIVVKPWHDGIRYNFGDYEMEIRKE